MVAVMSRGHRGGNDGDVVVAIIERMLKESGSYLF